MATLQTPNFSFSRDASQKFPDLGPTKNFRLPHLQVGVVPFWVHILEYSASPTPATIYENPVSWCCPTKPAIQIQFRRYPQILLPVPGFPSLRTARNQKGLFWGVKMWQKNTGMLFSVKNWWTVIAVWAWCAVIMYQPVMSKRHDLEFSPCPPSNILGPQWRSIISHFDLGEKTLCEEIPHY